MLSNYLRIAFRTLGKNKIYSFINIFGFGIGITCTLLILLWVQDELTYDAWQPKYERIFRLAVRATYDGKTNVWMANPIPAKDVLKEEHPGIVNVVVTDWGSDHLLAAANKADRSGIKKKGMYASEAFLDVFQHPIIAGDRATALKDMKSIVLTESTAKELFGDKDPLDQVVRVDDQDELKVTAVIRDVPNNSSDNFDFLMTWQLAEQIPWVKSNSETWQSYGNPIYVELNDPALEAEVEKKIFDLPARHGETDFPKEFMLYPMSRWHLNSNFDNGEEVGGMIVYVRTFAIVAGLILFIACVNFMNLATARAEKRAIEVGVRKSIGSKRSDLISQFIWESILTTAIAFALGVVMAQLLLPFYNQLVSKQLVIPYSSWMFAGGSLLTIVVVGVFAGSYPAFYLSAFKPVSVLKGGKGGRGATLPRKILVTMQFGLSMVLMITTVVVYQQIQHTKDRDLGYKPDNMLIVEAANDVQKNYKSIKDALLQTGVVESVTKSDAAITELLSWSPVDWPGKPDDQKYFFSMMRTEYDYVKTMGVKLLEGRDFSEDFKSDSNAVIVNRSAIELMGLKDPIGAKISYWGKQHEIIGIAENTVSGSPYESAAGPMALSFSPGSARMVTIRLKEGVALTESLKKIESVFNTFSPAYPFDFKFADDVFQQKFTSINLTSRLSSIFATLTLVITGLGLFGLAAFTAAQRTREMGIRKVMGASVQQLVQLVTKDFSVLVVIAFVVASPVGWWLVDQYLQQYPYRVDFQWWVFPLTGILALIFAIVIVSTQALRAARSNPAQSLRSE